ncbi:hypothetical protein D9611_004540 [Ephemerocybe angulata]|uniref:Large ribosomal subunit protein mL49 n=1 Tax=Ephemerocybe angulata TaxID=980116 RepID=A0A8H5BJC6_9AGAR|nr:hypothetical protein D9611_004540 [Tulosesus angulatus]
MFARCLWGARFFSQPAAAGAAQSLASPPAVAKYSFFVSRNSNGNLPVYSDIRNGGTRLLVSIRNVDGNASDLAKELSTSLFKAGSPEARRLKVKTNHQHVVIQGGRWTQEVNEWLKAKGF